LSSEGGYPVEAHSNDTKSGGLGLVLDESGVLEGKGYHPEHFTRSVGIVLDQVMIRDSVRNDDAELTCRTGINIDLVQYISKALFWQIREKSVS
jgi:hypothetical protein